MEPTNPQSALANELAGLDDESFLDELFDRAVALAGRAEHDLRAVASARPHLRAAIEELLHAARAIAVGRSADSPSIDGYVLVRELGHGAMGRVWLAQQQALGARLVALKVLPPAMSSSRRARERFLAEARALARVRHDHVVAIYDVIERDDLCAYAMEWVDGQSLAELIPLVQPRRAAARGSTAARVQRSASLAGGTGEARLALHAASWPQFIARIGIDVGRALSAVHAVGLIHRDVKPSNILLRPDGSALVSDFGLVHDSDGSLHTLTGEFVGTLAFASPEVLRGDHRAVDARSDVFSVGATLYQALAFQLPFGCSSAASVQARAEAGAFAPLRQVDPNLPRDLETIVSTALDPDPARRYASATELADDLERLLALQPIRAKRATLLARALKAARRNSRTLFGSIAGIALGVAAAAVLGWWLYDRAQRPGRAAEHLKRARFELIGTAISNQSLIADLAGERLGTGIVGGFPRPSELEPMRRALAEYDQSLRLAPDDIGARIERDVVACFLAGAARAELQRDLYERGEGRRYVELTDFLVEQCPALVRATSGLAAQTLDAQELRQVVATSSPADRKAFGLLGIFGGHGVLSLVAWNGLDLQLETDPLVDGLIGNAYLNTGRLELAYVRLMRALDAYPDSALLNVSVADVAVRLGETTVARRLLERCDQRQFPDYDTTFQRVTADLMWLEGRVDEALPVYRRLADSPSAGNPICALRLAQIAEQRGDFDRAWRAYARSASYIRHWIEPRHGFNRCAERWWQGLSEERRLDAMRAAARTPPHRPEEWITHSSHVEASSEALDALAGSGALVPILRFQRSYPTRPYAPALPDGPTFLWRDEVLRDAQQAADVARGSLPGLRCTAELVYTDAFWRALPPSLRVRVLLASYALDRELDGSPDGDRAATKAVATGAGRLARGLLTAIAASRELFTRAR